MLSELYEPLEAVRPRRLACTLKLCGPGEAAVKALFEAASQRNDSFDEINRTLVVNSTNNPYGFVVGVRKSNTLSPAALLELHTTLLLEPGTFVYCSQQLPCRTSLLEHLAECVELAKIVDGSGPKGSQPLPNHFVLVIYDWPTSTPAAEDVEARDWLWKVEPTYDEFTGTQNNDAMARNTLRMMLDNMFLSTNVVFLAEPQSVSFRERVVQVLRSQCFAGCLEGWAIPSTIDRTTVPLDVRTQRITRVVNSFSLPSALDNSWRLAFAQSWADRLAQQSFVEYCEARLGRLTGPQVREAFDLVMARVQALGAWFKTDVTVDLSNDLQRFLFVVQERETRNQSMRDAANTRMNAFANGSGSSSFTVGAMRRIQSTYTNAVQTYVPAQHQYWFSGTGLATVCVALSLVAWVIHRL